MNNLNQKTHRLIEKLEELIAQIRKAERKHEEAIASVSFVHRKSARNLVHYRAFRQNDLRSLQNKLRNLGMSRFARSEAHVLASILNNLFILHRITGDGEKPRAKSGLSIKNGRKLLVRNTQDLLGFRSKGRRVRIMVTQPTESAKNYSMVRDMVRNGMNCARINCAHDRPEVWLQIIQNVQKAAKAGKKKVKIAMDLAGPKIRTGPIVPGAQIKKISPMRDEEGKVVEPAIVCFEPVLTLESVPNTLPMSKDWINGLVEGEQVSFEDTRGKKRELQVFEVRGKRASAYCFRTSYFRTGMTITSSKGVAQVGELPPIDHAILLRKGEVINLHREGILGESAQVDKQGQATHKAHISCQLPEVFKSVKEGEKVLFDDGKIEGKILQVNAEDFDVRITRALKSGTKLKSEKGINFPDTRMAVSGLTEKDREDLKFISAHADMVNFSFVNKAEDVRELLAALSELKAPPDLGVILKIETQSAYDHLIDILIAGMRVKNLGVMIARGDLAVETGWDQIGKVQREMLSVCNAAHVPVVWATQVLENMAKKGLPSRSEITDTTMSLKAECVMLNKGPFINDAIRLLDKILADMETFNDKNEALLPQLKKLRKQ